MSHVSYLETWILFLAHMICTVYGLFHMMYTRCDCRHQFPQTISHALHVPCFYHTLHHTKPTITGRYILHNFDSRSPVSNFLPGVAGVFGKPVWSFYVNRGQGIASFGLESKDYPILEFSSANKAYQLTPYIGFRTFLQGSRGGHKGKEDGESFLIEPFSPANSKIVGLWRMMRPNPRGPCLLEQMRWRSLRRTISMVLRLRLPTSLFPRRTCRLGS